MSQRKKVRHTSAISDKELAHLRQLSEQQSLAELRGLTPEQAAHMAEERVFFKSGDQKGKAISGGESKFINLGDNIPGTATYIEYIDASGNPKTAATVITPDKKLIDQTGKVMRELY